MASNTTDATAPPSGSGLRLFLGAVVALGIAAAAWIGWRAVSLDTSASAARTPADPDDAFPREVELTGGGTLLVEQRPRSIVPCSARAIELVAALVEPQRIAGAPEQAFEYTTEPGAKDALADRPRFDTYVAEPVLALSPDLVIADPWQSADTHARLESAGVPVFVLPDANDWPAMRSVVELLAEVLGEEEAAQQLIADGNARVSALRERTSQRERVAAVSYSNFGAQGFTAGTGTTHHEMMTLAGLVNLAAEDGRVGHGNMTFEDLLRLDPDVIVVSLPLNAPAGPSGDRGGASGAVLRSEPSLQGLRAIREDRIVALPAGLFASASHGILRGAEVLADDVDALLVRLESSGGGE